MRILAILTVLLCPIFMNAQVELGFRVGVNMSEADLQRFNDDPFELENMAGINAGLFANIQLGNLLALQPELSFSQKGFSASWDNADTTSTLSTNYLEMPLLLELALPIGKNFRLFGNAGPNVSYLMEAQEEFLTITNGETINASFDMNEEDLNRLDFGVNFGGGISMRANRWKFLLDVRYNMGLREIMETEDTFEFFEKAKHRVTNIGVSISYFAFGYKMGNEVPKKSFY